MKTFRREMVAVIARDFDCSEREAARTMIGLSDGTLRAYLRRTIVVIRATLAARRA